MYFSSWENGIPLNKLFTLGEDFLTCQGMKMLKRAESHCCEVSTLGILACNFSTFFKVTVNVCGTKFGFRSLKAELLTECR